MHGSFEIDRIKHFDLISVTFQQLPSFNENLAFRICDTIGTRHLHQIRLHKESGLSGSGTSLNEDQLSLIKPLSERGASPLVIEQYNAFMQGHTVTDPEVSLDFSHGLPHQVGQLIDQTCKGFFSENDYWWFK